MTTQEFTLKIESANTVISLTDLRRETSAPKFVGMIKQKVSRIAINEGFERHEINLSTLKNITINTDCNTLIEVDIPVKNRTFNKFAGKKMLMYVNHKEGSKHQTVELFVKAV